MEKKDGGAETNALGVGYDCIYWEGRVLLLKDGDGRHHKKCEDNNGDLLHHQ